MYTGLVAHVSPVLQMQAALAEAWHVDGCFVEARAGWETLALTDSHRAEAMLKAAISCFASECYEQGFSWLHNAEQAGASAEETLYVHAQACWQQGQIKDAIDLFQEAEQIAPLLGKASNALGVLYWQLGWVEKAHRQFALACQRDPSDGEALVNMASLSLRPGHTNAFAEGEQGSILRQAQDLLAQAAALQPYRAEAFIWYARLLRRVCAEKEAEAQEMLGKARLRSRFRGPISHAGQEMDPAAYGQVQVRGTFSLAQALLTFLYTYPKKRGPAFVSGGQLRVQRGYSQRCRTRTCVRRRGDTRL